MASLGSDVQATSNALVAVIEEMKERRTALDKNIRREEEERARLLSEIKALNFRLSALDEGLQKKTTARTELDKVINDTSEAFRGILNASKQLLSNVQGSSGLSRADAQ